MVGDGGEEALGDNTFFFGMKRLAENRPVV